MRFGEIKEVLSCFIFWNIMLIKSLDVGTPFVPDLVDSFMKQDASIGEFVSWNPTLDAISQYAEQRIFSPEKRDVLV